MAALRVLCATSRKSTQIAVEKLCEHFHTMTWNITHANNGSDALFKLGNIVFDLVILEQGLSKITSDRVWIGLRNKKDLSETPILWIGAPEKSEDFTLEIEKRKIIRVNDPTDSKVLLEALVTCLDSLSNRKKHDQFNIRVLNPGDYLMRAGDPADHVFILKSGRLKAQVHEHGQDKILGMIEPGEFVGEMAYLNGEKRSADVIAEDLSELVSIPIKQFEITLANRPTWGVALMKVLAKRLKQSNLFSSRKNEPK